MEIFDRAEQVVNDVLRVLHLQVYVALDNLLKVTLCILHHDVKRVKRLRIRWVKQLYQLDDEGVLQLAHEGHLAQDPLAVCLVFKDVLHALDGDLAPGRLMRRQGHLAVTTCPQQTLTCVIIADFPILELVEPQVAPPSLGDLRC